MARAPTASDTPAQPTRRRSQSVADPLMTSRAYLPKFAGVWLSELGPELRYCARWQAASARLPLGHLVEHWFDVDHRGAVERFELADLDPQALDGEDLGPVHADRVGAVG